MDLNIHVKVELVETPALINCFSAFCSTIEKCTALLNGEQPAPAPVPAFAEPYCQPELARTLPEPKAEAKPVEQEATKAAEKAPGTPVEKPKEATPKKYTLDDFRIACVPLMDADPGITKKIQEMIKGFGVNSLTQLPEDKYPELAEKLIAVGAKL